MEKSKLIYEGEEALDKIKNGVRKVADIVQTTFGPKGMNTLLSRDWRVPDITNDGVTIARTIELDDEAENYVKEAFVDVSKRTNEQAGDGTTGAIILARAILEEGWKKTAGVMGLSGSKTIQAKFDIEKDKLYVLEELKKITKKATSLKDLTLVATASMEDPIMGARIAEVVHKVGKDGYVSVEEGYTEEIEIDIVEGMKFHGTYPAPFIVTNDRKEAVYEKVDILLTNNEFTSISVFKNLFEALVNSGKKNLVIFGKKFSLEILIKMAEARAQGFNFLPVKIPSLLSEEHKDIAIFTGSKFFNINKGDKIEEATLKDLGYVEKIAIDEDDTILLGGRGTDKEIKEYIKSLKVNQEVEQTDIFKKKMDRRIASMTSGVGIIKVGGRSDVERLYLKRKIEDSQYATKCALQEGVVKGGGQALKEIGESMPESILSQALQAPYERIQTNAGGKLEIPETVIDPVKVIRCALENACSVSSMLLTTGTLIVDKRERTEYEGMELLAKSLKK